MLHIINWNKTQQQLNCDKNLKKKQWIQKVSYSVKILILNSPTPMINIYYKIKKIKQITWKKYSLISNSASEKNVCCIILCDCLDVVKKK